MNTSERNLAFLSYLFSVVVALPVLLFAGRQKFARFHALQSLGIFVVAVLGMGVWLAVGWFVSLVVPLVGAAVAAALFTLVMSLYVALVFVSIRGMMNAWREKRLPVPLVGISIIRVYIVLSGQPRAPRDEVSDDADTAATP